MKVESWKTIAENELGIEILRYIMINEYLKGIGFGVRVESWHLSMDFFDIKTKNRKKN